MTYSYDLNSGNIIRDSDDVVVAPCQSANDEDFLAYIAWVNEGNQPTEVRNLNVAELVKLYQDAIQLHLDKVVQSRNYDGILSLCSYATSVVPRFSGEGQAGVNWRDAVWLHAYQYLMDFQLGKRPVITPEELIAELPSINW